MFKLVLNQSAAKKDLSSHPSRPRLTHANRGLTTSGILMLQRTIGNQGVQRILQNQERNADASSLVRKPLGFGHDFSRIPMQPRPNSASENLTINEPGDKYEQEADRVAEQVMRISQPNQSDQRSIGSQNAESVHGSRNNNLRGGNALDSETRQFFEPRFGHSFANVRVHSDRAANESARSLGARAYTAGEHIAFASGECQLSTREGRQLLAHELAHVIQQTRVSEHTRTHSLARSLSKAPPRPIQRKLIATGDAAGFAALANSIIAVQVEVVVGRGGEISLRNTDVQGPPTPEAQVLVDTLRRVINNSGTTSIEFIHGTTSTRESDRRVLGGSFPQSKVDLDDVAVLGTQESIGLGQGATAGAILAHEVEEQFRKQQLGQGYDEAHEAALAVEAQAVGAARTVTQRTISGGIEVTYTYNYPDGRVVELKFDVVNGNRTNIRRTVRR